MALQLTICYVIKLSYIWLVKVLWKNGWYRIAILIVALLKLIVNVCILLQYRTCSHCASKIWNMRACSSGVEHLPFKQRVGGSSPPTLTFLCPVGGTGRHTILRGWRPKGHASSSLASRTLLPTKLHLELDYRPSLSYLHVVMVLFLTLSSVRTCNT